MIMIINITAFPAFGQTNGGKIEKLNSTTAKSGTTTTSGKKNNYKLEDVTRIIITPSREALSVGDTTSISLVGILTDGNKVDLTMQKVDYISTNESVIKISKDYGLILLTALSTGEAYIIASLTYNEKTISASYKIKVVKTLNSKTRSTYYTLERVQTARNNIQKYKWAENMKNSVVNQANKYLKLGYDNLWNLVTPQSIPRSYAVNQKIGCLNCGKKIDDYGAYPYILDATNSTFKLECPSCHMKFPTNDFKAYYESGKNKQGIFDPKLAKKSLLVNKAYPEKGSRWGVDDGNGYVDGKGNRFSYIAYYNHWGLWYKGSIIKALNSFRDSYVYTGDVKYARAGIILLDRIADVYPAMDIAKYKLSYGFLNCSGGGNTGKIVGCIWETEISKDLLKAYDAFFPAMEDYETVNYIRNKTKLLGVKIKKNTATEIKRNIEDGIVRQIFPAIKNAQIRGNNGMHQSALALAAVVLDMLPETRKWLDFDFNAGTASKTQVTGGNILATLVNDVDRDGHGNEASPQYNRLWLTSFIEIANILDGYDLYPAADLYKNVKFRKMFYAMHSLILTDLYSALIGDSGSTGCPTNYLNKDLYTTAFEQYGDPILAQVVYLLNNNKIETIKGDIFSADPEKVANDIKKVISTNGTLKLNSINSTGYGFAVLRDGNGKIDFRLPSEKNQVGINNTQRAVSMYYGRNQGHGHSDTLNIGITAYGLDLSPDLGYPEYADESAHRMEWVRNTISHNTVVVDKNRQMNQTIAEAKHFDDSEFVKLIDIEAPKVYPQTSIYRRTTAMIKVDDENSYVIDFFRVKGGKDHYYSFHGAEGEVNVKGLQLMKQAGKDNAYIGTYAGETVQFGERPEEDSVKGFYYTGGGFHWLSNVQTTRLNLTGAGNLTNAANTTPPAVTTTTTTVAMSAANFSVDWKTKDTWNVFGEGNRANTDVHLKLTMLGDFSDVALCDGIPPRNNFKNPKALKYMIAHRSGENLDSLFNAVIEPYKAEEYIESVTQAAIKINGQIMNDTKTRAVKVTLKNGRIDYIVNSTDGNTTYTIDNKFSFRGFFGVYCEKDGKPLKSYLNDGVIIGENIISNGSRIAGTVEDFTKALSVENEIKVSVDFDLDSGSILVDQLVGKYIYINNDNGRNAVYQIKGIKRTDKNKLTLNIGDVSPVHEFKDVNDFSKGYVYDFAVGDRFVIPLTKLWN
jgi:oligo-alginate lyase